MRKYLKFFLVAVSLVILSLAVRQHVFEIVVVKSEGMLPSLLKNDYLFVNKLAYGLRSDFIGAYISKPDLPKRGDVILFESPLKDSKPFLKRVVALPGDEVVFRGGRLFINSKDISVASQAFWDSPYKALSNFLAGEKEFYVVRTESYEKASVDVIAYEFGEKKSFGPYEVPESKVFVMGDYRPASRDSRFFGAIDMHFVIGKAERVAFSCEEILSELPVFCSPTSVRWSRVFTKIP